MLICMLNHKLQFDLNSLSDPTLLLTGCGSPFRRDFLFIQNETLEDTQRRSRNNSPQFTLATVAPASQTKQDRIRTWRTPAPFYFSLLKGKAKHREEIVADDRKLGEKGKETCGGVQRTNGYTALFINPPGKKNSSCCHLPY